MAETIYYSPYFRSFCKKKKKNVKKCSGLSNLGSVYIIKAPISISHDVAKGTYRFPVLTIYSLLQSPANWVKIFVKN